MPGCGGLCPELEAVAAREVGGGPCRRGWPSLRAPAWTPAAHHPTPAPTLGRAPGPQHTLPSPATQPCAVGHWILTVIRVDCLIKAAGSPHAFTFCCLQRGSPAAGKPVPRTACGLGELLTLAPAPPPPAGNLHFYPGHTCQSCPAPVRGCPSAAWCSPRSWPQLPQARGPRG